VPMTIPVVAAALEKHPRKMEYLRDAGIELAGHGDVHDPFVGPVEIQARRLAAMNRIFESVLGQAPKGFRAPFLAHDANLYPALARVGIQYDSSRIARDLLLRIRNLASRRPLAYRDPVWRIPSMLVAHISGRTVSRPYPVARGVIELPVFELDDWFFFESDRGPRLGENEGRFVAKTWLNAARHFRRSGNILVIQAHPKRISPSHLKMLEVFIERARRFGSEFVCLDDLVKRSTAVMGSGSQ
jgi:peptidoglycan/xylan/chitin deacetylase (PgdA/CDA1 family)